MKRFTAKPDIASPRGISVIEVLISMGILAIGLLGVAAMFPVGSHYMERGDEYDRADAVAEAALNDAVASGLLDPENWLMFRPRNVRQEGYYVTSVPEYLNVGMELVSQRIEALPPITDLSQKEARSLAIHNIEQASGAPMAAEYGAVFVIDPLGVASGVVPAASTAPNKYKANESLSYFPAASNRTNLMASVAGTNTLQSNWWPWQNGWPVRRLTIRGPSIPGQTVAGLMADSLAMTSPAPVSGHPIPVSAAEQIVRSTDDLSVEFGDDADLPSQLLADEVTFAAGSPPVNVGSQSKGSYSWLLTVVPTTVEARNALASSGSGSSYDVSSVVLKGRALAETYDRAHPDELGGTQQLMLGERLAGARILSTGTSGGEIELYRQITGSGGGQPYELLDASNDAPWEELRAGGWVMLVGPHPQSTTKKPFLFAQWYRVVASDDSQVTGAALDGRVLGPTLALRGPDFPWQGTETITQDLRVIIVPAAVAVHTRTLQLSAGASWAPQ